MKVFQGIARKSCFCSHDLRNTQKRHSAGMVTKAQSTEETAKVLSCLKKGESLERVQFLQLNARNAKLRSLVPLSPCANLRKLDLSRNSISSLEGAEKLVRLESLIVYNNKIGDLGDLLRLRSLEHLTEVCCVRVEMPERWRGGGREGKKAGRQAGR